MSILDGPGEGTWSVFALKVVEERDELRRKLAGEAAHIKSLEGLLVDAVRQRDEARAEVEALKYPRSYIPPGEERSLALSAIMISQVETEIRALRAEVEMLRGVGCREAKAGEPESGPCGACLKCAEERGAKWALERHGNPFAGKTLEQYAEEICRDARSGR